MKKEIKLMIELTKKHLEKDAGCGGWCIRCSIAKAMGDDIWDEKDKTSDFEALSQVFKNNIHSCSRVDFIMEETRDFLKKKSGDEKMVFKTKKEAERFLENNLE